MNDNALKKKRLYGPDVRIINGNSLPVVEKTYRNRSVPVRFIGMILTHWERYIYSKLQGITGIPALLPSPDRYTLLTKFMGGSNLREVSKTPDKSYFSALETLIREMHTRGIIHLDLRNRRNYGIDEKGNPYLVDFASSLYIPMPAKLRSVLCLIDWMGFLKVKEKLMPSLITVEEKKLLHLGNSLSSLWFPAKAVQGLRSAVKNVLAFFR